MDSKRRTNIFGNRIYLLILALAMSACIQVTMSTADETVSTAGQVNTRHANEMRVNQVLRKLAQPSRQFEEEQEAEEGQTEEDQEELNSEEPESPQYEEEEGTDDPEMTESEGQEESQEPETPQYNEGDEGEGDEGVEEPPMSDDGGQERIEQPGAPSYEEDDGDDETTTPGNEGKLSEGGEQTWMPDDRWYQEETGEGSNTGDGGQDRLIPNGNYPDLSVPIHEEGTWDYSWDDGSQPVPDPVAPPQVSTVAPPLAPAPQPAVRPIPFNEIGTNVKIPAALSNPTPEYLAANTSIISNASERTLIIYMTDNGGAMDILGELSPGNCFSAIGFVGLKLNFAVLDVSGAPIGTGEMILKPGVVQLEGNWAVANAGTSRVLGKLSAPSRQNTKAELLTIQKLKLMKLAVAKTPAQRAVLQAAINQIRALGRLRELTRFAIFVLGLDPLGQLQMPGIVFVPAPPTFFPVVSNFAKVFLTVQIDTQLATILVQNPVSPAPIAQNVPAFTKRPLQAPPTSPQTDAPKKILGMYVESFGPQSRQLYVFRTGGRFAERLEVKQGGVWVRQTDRTGKYRYDPRSGRLEIKRTGFASGRVMVSQKTPTILEIDNARFWKHVQVASVKKGP